MKGNGVVIPQKMERSSSSSIAKWLVCYKLRWSQVQIDEVDACIFQQLRR